MRDKGVGVDVPCDPTLDERGDAAAPLEAAEGRAGDAAAGDQVARNDVERLALACDAAHRRETPAHACRLDRLPHHGDVPGRLERVVGPEPVCHFEDSIDRLFAAQYPLGRALPTRELEPLLREIDADNAFGTL